MNTKARAVNQNFFLVFLIALISSVSQSNAQAKPSKLSKDQALEDFQSLRFALEYVHPRLYKYDDKATVDQRFDSLRNLIKEGISELDFLALVSVANASVRCGHLYTIPQGVLGKVVLQKKILPFNIKIAGDKLYILNDCSKSSISNGSELLTINGKSAKEILGRIRPGIAADGYIQTRRIKLIERTFYNSFHGFDLYYYLHVDRGESFKVEYVDYQTKKPRTNVVEGIRLEERRAIQLSRYGIDELSWFKQPSPTFEVDKSNNLAVLTVSRSFHDKTIDPDFDSFIRSAFQTIKVSKTENLILDLRNNEGGDEHQQMEIMSYLYDQPFKLYQNIYLSHLDFRPLRNIIVERDTSQLLFNNDDDYMRKINDNLWINNYEYSDNLTLRPPRENVFKGKLYVLMNGVTFSSAADLAADLKRTTNAVFIGEESGGAYEGPTGGDNIVIQLPNSKIIVRISPNIHLDYMYEKHPVGRGVLPTHEVVYTVKDIVEKKDLELDLAKMLIRKSTR
jgi:hypothetical protein